MGADRAAPPRHPRRRTPVNSASMGAVTANVSYWISGWCIRPRNKEDFAVVLRYLGDGADVDRVWERLRRIDSAHRSAGQRYADDLQQALTPHSVERLVAIGWCIVRPRPVGQRDTHRPCGTALLTPTLCRSPCTPSADSAQRRTAGDPNDPPVFRPEQHQPWGTRGIRALAQRSGHGRMDRAALPGHRQAFPSRYRARPTS